MSRMTHSPAYWKTTMGCWSLILVALSALPAPVAAAPNMVANGDLEQPRERAQSRLSPTDNEAIFEIPGDRGFGRVIARGQGAGKELLEGLKVGYVQNPGSSRGLLIDAREINVSTPYEIAVWFDLRGQVRPDRQYAYNVMCLPTGQGKSVPTLEMIAPAIWADGKLMGATVPLVWSSNEKLLSEFAKRGTVKTPKFKYQTGGQSLVLKLPRNFKGQLFIVRVSLRELDNALLAGERAVMPTPTRYIAIDDILEEDIADALTRSTEALQNMQSTDGFWQAGGVDNGVSLTASIIDTLARRGVDLSTKPMTSGLRWLSEQAPTATEAVASRLMLFARHGKDEYRQTIAQDLLRLINAQFKDGGWNDSSADDVQKDRKLHASNLPTLAACLALREAHYAGFNADVRTWRKAAGYWRGAASRDGGFRAMLDSYGGLGEATTTQNTAAGLSGLYVTLDMAFADGAARCTQYLSNSDHREKINRAVHWMEEYYDEYYKKLPTLDAEPNPFLNASNMVMLTRLSGIRAFRDKDVFRTEAQNIMAPYDPTSGLFGESIAATTDVLSILSDGAAPIVLQRLILGGLPDFRLSRDAAHMVRYMVDRRHEPLNWRETFLDVPVEEWLEVPVLYVHVAGDFEIGEEHWKRVRDYCFGGGAVVFNIAEDAEAQRAKIETGLGVAFPEYQLAELAGDDPFWGKGEEGMSAVKAVRTIGNGLKHFAFLLPQDWSCRLNTYRLEEHPETFRFFDRMLTYTLDGEAPRSSFAPSTWDKPAYANDSVRVARMEVGGDQPAYPDLIATLDRTLRSEYRLEVQETPARETARDVALLWISCTGPQPMSPDERSVIQGHIDRGTFLFAEVLSGAPEWAEAFRSDLLKVDDALRIRKLPTNHPLITGMLYKTFGYDVRIVELRRALREEYEKLPRMDAYVIERNGEEVGMLSVHDIGSGLGYVQFSQCRGVMPRGSRKVATNTVLYAMQRRLALD